VHWYRKSAEQDHAIAQNNLGAMYEKGQGVPQDYVHAHKWWNLAAAKGHKASRKNRDIIAKQMTPQQIAEAQRLARDWKSGPPTLVLVKETPPTLVLGKEIKPESEQGLWEKLWNKIFK
jgi:TPR repeat protein